MKYSFDDIARYADDLMTADERRAFEAALGTDPELQQQLALYRDVDTALQQQFGKDEQREQLQGTLQQMRQEYFGEKAESSLDTPSALQPDAQPAKVIPFKRYLGVAIAVAAILVVGLFVWNPFAPNLYEKYAATQMVAQVERGSHIDTVLQDATTAFNNKEFTVAAVMLAEVVQQQPDNSYALFYFGVALLQTDQLPLARAVFEKLFKGESAFKYEAAFYEALSYLKDKDKDSAKDWLEKIPADAANYSKAQELMKRL
jgi:cytochrome c-type biogenesis protein CcmH/NrfG